MNKKSSTIIILLLFLVLLIVVWRHYAPVNIVNPNEIKDFGQIVIDNNVEAAKSFIEKKPRVVNVKDDNKNGRTPLCTALLWSNLWGNSEMAKLLIEKNANVNIKDNDSNSPLYLAAFSGNKEMVELLIKKGANINAKNINSLTPLHVAVSALENRKEIVELLIKNGANVNVKGNFGETPLDRAKEKGNMEIVEILQKAGAK